MLPTTTLDLFAGIPVTSFRKARNWYEKLFGSKPAFRPNKTEAVWELAKHRYVYLSEAPEHAGHARLTVFVADLDELVASIEERGLAAVTRESYPNGVRKITFRDTDGNEIGFGGASGTPTARRRRSSGKTGAAIRGSRRPKREGD
jgi:predicted enzyme related to lactoylglutathione lyase